MSDLRIRSEAVADTVWPQSFMPPAVHAGDEIEAGDDAAFAPFLVAAARALTLLYGVPVAVLPGRPPPATGLEPAPPVAPVLAALLATAQLGGDMVRATLPGAAMPEPGGVATARQARAIADALAAVAARVWPLGERRDCFDLDIAIGAIAGHARVDAPEQPEVPAPVPIAALATRLFDLPMRVRVELSSALVAVAALLPLRAGTVLPIDPSPEMPLVVGDHHVGRAVVTPQPDGRQQATIVTIGVALSGGSAA